MFRYVSLEIRVPTEHSFWLGQTPVERVLGEMSQRLLTPRKLLVVLSASWDDLQNADIDECKKL
jgi:hypothetical protein